MGYVKGMWESEEWRERKKKEETNKQYEKKEEKCLSNKLLLL